MFQYKCTIVKIYDADTITVNIDLGFYLEWKKTKLRLYGINAPEITGIEREAGLRSKQFVVDKLPIGTEVIINTYKDSTEKYGRFLAEVFVNLSEKSINQQLIDNGLAKEYYGEGAK